jgi:hypothetical protein
MQAYNYVATSIAVGNDSLNRLEAASLERTALKLSTHTHIYHDLSPFPALNAI